MRIGSFIKSKNASKKLELIDSLFRDKEKVLDFGCGDLSLALSLKKKKPVVTITGIDVVDFGVRQKGIKVVVYDGEKLPFKNKTFDTVLCYHVLHHCKDPISSFFECIRVTRKRIIIIEPTLRNQLDLPFMKLIDWMSNVWKKEKIPLTYQFLPHSKWYELFKKKNLKLKKEIKLNKFLSLLPLGQAYMFELHKKRI